MSSTPSIFWAKVFSRVNLYLLDTLLLCLSLKDLSTRSSSPSSLLSAAFAFVLFKLGCFFHILSSFPSLPLSWCLFPERLTGDASLQIVTDWSELNLLSPLWLLSNQFNWLITFRMKELRGCVRALKWDCYHKSNRKLIFFSFALFFKLKPNLKSECLFLQKPQQPFRRFLAQ